MNRQVGAEENGELKPSVNQQQQSSYVKQEGYAAYDAAAAAAAAAYVNYSASQPPLPPGQPPLPPMPPPQVAPPPPPQMYSAIPAQMTQVWPAAQWQWITAQSATPMQQHQATAQVQYQRDMPMRNNYIKRERFNNNRNNMYQQGRQNFNHRKNRNRRYEQNQHSQYEQAYYGASLGNSIGVDWQRNEALINMQLSMQNQLPHLAPVNQTRRPDDSADQDIKEEIVVKKSKQRKPMSQSYPSRPWIRSDAERALEVENEYNKTVRAQSLIIKFPDPDLNKDVVRDFHPGIQNIHFQSPSGPRYCFVQMAEGVDIDEAIKELEKIPFGVGHLKVERKSLRDEDNPTPEEIDPYTLYIGNLPESVNVNEVKSKFPTAARVDVGYAQKMRNTRYAFIRYNNVDESISAYRNAHDLMWDTRSIIVRFRRQRGNTCLPGEQKTNPKRNETPNAAQAVNSKTNEKSSIDKDKNHITSLDNERLQSKTKGDKNSVQEEDHSNVSESSTTVTSSVTSLKRGEDQLKKIKASHPPSRLSTNNPPLESGESSQEEDLSLITEIKEEPIDYDEMNEISMDDEDDDDDDEEIEFNQGEEDDEDSDYDEDLSHFRSSFSEESRKATSKEDIPSDDLDKLFSGVQNTATEIGF